MKFKSLLALLAAVIFLSAGAAFAQEAPKAEMPKEEPKPIMDISGVMYLWWQDAMDTEGTAATKARKGDHFQMNRVYLNFAKKFDDVWSMKVTTDISSTGTNDTTDGTDTMFFKNAYLQMKQDFDPIVLTVQYGLVGTPISGLIDGKSGYRWINNNYFDNSKALLVSGTDGKALSLDPTADMGVKADIAVMKMVTFTGMYSNGEGYSRGFSEDKNDVTKAYYGMVTLNPVKELSIAGFYKTLQGESTLNVKTTAMNDNNYLNTIGGSVIWSDDTFKVGASYFKPKQKDSATNRTTKYTLFDAFANINLKSLIDIPVLLAGRYAQGTSELSTGDVKSTAWEAGLGYKFAKNVDVLAMYQVVDLGSSNSLGNNAGANKSFWIKTGLTF